jgi:erythromycin esterase-like protein
MSSRIKILVVSLIFVYQKGLTQKFLNLDFEYGVYHSQPPIWSIEGDGEMYYGFVDSAIKNHGVSSLHLQLRNGEIYAYLSIPGNLVRGSIVQIRAYIKFGRSDSLSTMLAFRDPANRKPITSPIVKSNNDEWTPVAFQVSFDSAYGSDRLLIALIGIGTGELWLDNVSIKISGVEYGNGQPDFREPTQNEIKQLNLAANPIIHFNSDDSLGDLDPVKKIVGDVRIIALGENSHGSAPIFRLKLRLIKFLVTKAGFSIFALESPADRAEKINNYVLSGKGTIDEVVDALSYPSWQVKEMLDIIEWMKTYNKTATKKIEFKGFDKKGTATQSNMSRDEGMAYAIASMIESSSGRKIILSGDNTHITKASGKMGSFLQQWYGNNYVTLGFTYNQGTYAAYGPEKYYEVYPSYPGTAEYFFSKCKYKNFYLDLRNIRSIPLFDTLVGFRSIGSRPQLTTQFAEIDLRRHFDIVVYIERSEHTNNIR